MAMSPADHPNDMMKASREGHDVSRDAEGKGLSGSDELFTWRVKRFAGLPRAVVAVQCKPWVEVALYVLLGWTACFTGANQDDSAPLIAHWTRTRGTTSRY